MLRCIIKCIGMAVSSSSSGLETLEHRGQRAGLLADESTPVRVQGYLGDVLTQAKCAGAYGGYGCALARPRGQPDL